MRVDWGELLRTAVRAGIFPDRFWDFTLYELKLVFDATAKHVDDELQRMALGACWMINTMQGLWAKNPPQITPARLLGRQVSLSDCVSPDDFAQRVADLKMRKRGT